MKKKLGSKAAKVELPTEVAPDAAATSKKSSSRASQIAADVLAQTSEWDDAEIFIAFPCQKMTNPVTAWTLVAMAKDYGKKVYFDIELGDSMIYHARNRLADRFLASTSSHMLMIDDDMVPPIGRAAWLKQVCRLPDSYPEELASIQTIDQLLSHGVTLVGGSYFGRRPGGPLLAGELGSASQIETTASQIAQMGLLEVDWVGTGCLLVHRSVFEDIKEKHPELGPKENESLGAWNFFPPIRHGMGEDQGFCQLAKEAGHQPHVDLACQVPHIGYKAFGIGDHSL